MILLRRLLVVVLAPFVVAPSLGGCDSSSERPPQSATSSTGTIRVESAPAPKARPAQPVQPRQQAGNPLAPLKHRCVVPFPTEPAPAARPAKDCPPDPDGNPTLPRAYVTFSDAPGKPRVGVELAKTDAHRARGLMYRTQMNDDEGMLFEFEGERIRSFWMKNTCIPLDMLFIATDGTIVGILEQVPTLNTAPRRIPCRARYVLELNAGWCRDHGISSGQKISIDASP